MLQTNHTSDRTELTDEHIHRLCQPQLYCVITLHLVITLILGAKQNENYNETSIIIKRTS